MYLGSYTTFNEGYAHLREQVNRRGTPFEPRGKPCVEVRPAMFSITDPERALYTGVTRKLNLAFLAAETVSYIAGWGNKEHADVLCALNSNMRQFVNESTGVFDGAYGPRMVTSLPWIVNLLQEDPSTRQAVMGIWRPGPAQPGSKDIPCTLTLQFMNQGGIGGVKRLGLVTSMRSNDINWGLPYDVAAFASLQLLVADLLGWEVGTYHHVDGSLHEYRDFPPNLPSERDERFVNLSLPRIGEFGNFLMVINVINEAHCFLNELHLHLLQDGKPRHDFRPRLELLGPRSAYWSGWASMVRWSWRDV